MIAAHNTAKPQQISASLTDDLHAVRDALTSSVLTIKNEAGGLDLTLCG